MESTEWVEVIALLSITLGAIIEFAPYLLAWVAPPLSSTGVIQLGTFSIAANMLYGFLFIMGGGFVLFYYLWWVE